MKYVLPIAIFLLTLTGVASAVSPPLAPEINPGSAATAVGLLTGALLVMRSRRK